jgi:large subunit ribosomal protein L14
MIQTQTLLKVSDNSGGKIVKCLKILKKGTVPRFGFVGDIIVASIKSIRTKNKLTSKVKKGVVVLAVIVKTKTTIHRPTSISFRFPYNSVVLLTKQKKPMASRIFGIIPKELRSKKFSKIVSLSSGVV